MYNEEILLNITEEWFAEWFDTPFYHILYENRDYKEAQRFIDNLENYFSFRTTDHILDLACGKGRFAKYLNQRGYEVTGIDLSEQSIKEAKAFANMRLHFHAGDMRALPENKTYHYVLNMFTSFGYFNTEIENEKAIASMAAVLNLGGILVLDFLNTQRIITTLPQEFSKKNNGIEFHIRKDIKDSFIIKDISFEVNNEFYSFQERVMAISQEMFERYFEKNNLKIIKMVGNYSLEPYTKQSDRMIFIAQKV